MPRTKCTVKSTYFVRDKINDYLFRWKSANDKNIYYNCNGIGWADNNVLLGL
jgi:hypothetical protein